MTHVLVSLTKGYGLGDAVQMSAVLRHLRKHRPNWVVDFQAELGRESVGRGIVRNAFAYGEPYPSSYYDAEVQIVLYDTFANWHDRPTTRVTSCLHERFAIEWDRECSRYEVNVSEEASSAAKAALSKVHRPVAFHFSGDSAKHKKDLSPAQAERVCRHIMDLGCTPLILDWRQCPIHITGGLASVRSLGLPSVSGRDAETNCAVIAECEAFVGIDSGPSKCASATDTPALVVWTGHHPAPFHDPAPNTTHLVPVGYHGLEPVCHDPGVVAFFEANYSVHKYEADPVDGVLAWLEGVL